MKNIPYLLLVITLILSCNQSDNSEQRTIKNQRKVIYPSDNPNYDVIIIMWVRQSEVPNGLDKILFSIVKKWIQEKWPFNKVAYPGRDVSWDEFE